MLSSTAIDHLSVNWIIKWLIRRFTDGSEKMGEYLDEIWLAVQVDLSHFIPLEFLSANLRMNQYMGYPASRKGLRGTASGATLKDERSKWSVVPVRD